MSLNLSDMVATIPTMLGVNENALLDYLSREGITVIETELGGAWGYYDHAASVVYLQVGMTGGHRLAALTHEAVHHWRGDIGPQSRAVEARVDEIVAQLLVDPVDYAWAETQYGWHTRGIAYALDLPAWVVRAYRRVLKRELQCSHSRAQ